MKGNDTQTFTTLRLSHAKSLQDITELKKLRDTVGKNIREAGLLVDEHDWDLTEHRENLKRTRENFSRFERRLSNATLSSLGNVNIGGNHWDGSVYSYSSGDDSCSTAGRRRYNRPSSVIMRPNIDFNHQRGCKLRQRYSNCSNSDVQSLSSAGSYSPKSHRSQILKQIVVPIYEDNFDSGVSVQTTTPIITGSRSTRSCLNYCHEKVDRRASDHHDVKKYKAPIYGSDTSSAASFPKSRMVTEVSYQKRSNNSNPLLTQTWRSTPNLLQDEPQMPARPRNRSLFDANSCHSAPFSKRDFASESSQWRSLPDLGSKLPKSQNEETKTKKAKKRKSLVYLFRRITKSGEYVLQNDAKDKKDIAKSKMKRPVDKDACISEPYSASALGRTIEVIEGKQLLHRVEIKLPRNGLYGFYIQEGFKKSKKGVFIGSFVNSQMKKLFAGVIQEGDEIVEINSLKVESVRFEKILDILHETKLLNLLIAPYVERKNR